MANLNQELNRWLAKIGDETINSLGNIQEILQTAGKSVDDTFKINFLKSGNYRLMQSYKQFEMTSSFSSTHQIGNQNEDVQMDETITNGNDVASDSDDFGMNGHIQATPRQIISGTPFVMRECSTNDISSGLYEKRSRFSVPSYKVPDNFGNLSKANAVVPESMFSPNNTSSSEASGKRDDVVSQLLSSTCIRPAQPPKPFSFLDFCDSTEVTPKSTSFPNNLSSGEGRGGVLKFNPNLFTKPPPKLPLSTFNSNEVTSKSTFVPKNGSFSEANGNDENLSEFHSSLLSKPPPSLPSSHLVPPSKPISLLESSGPRAAEAPKLKHFPGNITFEIDDDPLPKSAETHPRPPIIPTKLNPAQTQRDQSKREWICYYCKEQNSQDIQSYRMCNLAELHKHWNDTHAVNRPFRFYLVDLLRCGECRYYSSYHGLSKHYEKAHPNTLFVAIRNDRCALCLYAGDDLTAHDCPEREKVGRMKLLNPILYSEDDLAALQNIDKKLQCQYCKCVFKTRTEFRSHHEAQHGMNAISVDSLKHSIEFVICGCCQKKMHPYNHDDHLEEVVEKRWPNAIPKEGAFNRFDMEYLKTKVIFSSGLVVFKRNLMITALGGYWKFRQFCQGNVLRIPNADDLF